MTLMRRTLCCAVASAAFLLGASTTIAAKPPVRTVRPSANSQLRLQVLLDRADFSPGEIDGSGGRNTDNALAAFQAARELPSGPRGRAAALEALGAEGVEVVVPYAITAEDAAGPFLESIPQDMTEQSKLPGLYYTSLVEALGEKFHSAPALLKRLNPGARFAAEESIRVPNVARADHLAAHREKVTIVVAKKQSALTVYDSEKRVVFHAPVTSGSEHDPLPIGNWKVMSVTRHPVFSYDPALFWNADQENAKAKIPAGPNNPVGVVWIDIDKPHYGIHGTPEPGRIGYSASHGCVRLTNWDAEKLASLVGRGTPIVFQE